MPEATKGSSSSTHFGGDTPFKVQINFDIPLFEGQIDGDVVDKRLSLLEGYFFVHNFSNTENIIFALLKDVPHIRDLGDTYCEQNPIDENVILGSEPTWASFVEALKEQCYLVGNYDDQYTSWTILRQERDQMVSEYTNKFHTLCTKLGIRDSEWNLVLKYCNGLHRYIRTKMEFLDISSLGAAYRYVVKIEQKFKKKNKWEFESANLPHKQAKGNPYPQNKGRSNPC